MADVQRGGWTKGKNKGGWLKREKEHHQNTQVIGGHNAITLTLKAASPPLFHFPYVPFFSSPPLPHPFCTFYVGHLFLIQVRLETTIEVNLSLRDLGEGAGASKGPLNFYHSIKILCVCKLLNSSVEQTWLDSVCIFLT